MIYNKIKKVMVSAIVIVSITGSIGADAVATGFKYAYVDSNQYTKVTSYTKVSEKKAIGVMLNNIYKADGSSSDYKKIKAKFRSGGCNVLDNKNEVTICKNENNVYLLKSKYRCPGVSITFSAMGNNPALDCQISGIFDVDTTY